MVRNIIPEHLIIKEREREKKQHINLNYLCVPLKYLNFQYFYKENVISEQIIVK